MHVLVSQPEKHSGIPSDEKSGRNERSEVAFIL
jgi:hypothetical protein